MAKYDFKCKNCGMQAEIDIPMSTYEQEKDKQVCANCSGKMERVFVWNGGVTLCSGMYGIDGKNGWNT